MSVQPIPKWHQLAIIGNGFDLECGLPSKFSDFSATRESALQDFLNSEEPLFHRDVDAGEGGSTILTAWDVLLEGEQGSRWNDVESAIKSWVLSRPSGGITGLNRIDLLLKAIKKYVRGDMSSEALLGSNGHFLEIGPGSMYYSAAKIIVGVTGKDSAPNDRAEVLEFLWADLRLLESEFGRYLSAQVDGMEEYRERAQTLMFTILEDRFGGHAAQVVDESVLSFNYTRPSEVWRRGEKKIDFTNIHGRLDNEIVFGIDGKDCMDDMAALPFTKTYRIMSLAASEGHDIIHVAEAASAAGATNLIKFYGHSLSEADYSYFQAVFDAVKLYEGSTQLVFYYRPHGDHGCLEERRLAAKEDAMKAATRLLTAYGETLENRDHGKNLIHKLLLEGRLLVAELPNGIIRRG